MRKLGLFFVLTLINAVLAQSLFAQKGVDYKDDILKKINGIRAAHGAPALKWNDGLAKEAQARAELGAKNNETLIMVDADKGGSGFIMNKPFLIGTKKMTGDKVALSGVYEAIDYMYNHKNIKYNFNKPVFPTDPNTLGFVNLLWKASTEMGFGIAVGQGFKGNVYFYVSYNAKANAAALSANVSAPGGSQITEKNEFDPVIQEILRYTNEMRAKHNAPALTLNPKLSAYAQEWATLKAREGNLTHRVQTDYSENLLSWNQLSGKLPVDRWYDEIKHYQFDKPGENAEKAGHFTALIWHGSKEIGIGVAKSPKDNTYYYVCNYSPRGNLRGSFNRNVVKAGEKPLENVLDYTKGVPVKSLQDSQNITYVFGWSTGCESTKKVRETFDAAKKKYVFKDFADTAAQSLHYKIMEEAQNDDTMNHPAPHVVIKQKLYMSTGKSALDAKPLIPLMP
ncbi:MAG TPA: CAP domain-containing protein [Leptospiraceae bacterium]|nr:CAP domain-containing protein [Leptospiraceae bacterium]